ncbi:amidase domain-containing protein [Litchfieldia salsa]|uniref:Putative amidase domain-containing protein n=1 Tax=Litchfieldia salsa TaxID=930152 RepID=A0A1H0VRC0_9BACI|nr:amidase domain-containing protein [Litchfieldia salsa]SDP80904.1 Putative amidase domain-containing protein [Litchfieldia salsa]
MKEQLRNLINSKVHHFVGNSRSASDIHSNEMERLTNKKESFHKRSAEIIKCHAECKIEQKRNIGEETHLNYFVHYQYLVKQNDKLYMEEEYQDRLAIFRNDEIVEDHERNPPNEEIETGPLNRENDDVERVQYNYDRLAAVKYAERWWDDYNPEFKKFDVDCTNYISQCLHAGGIPMSGYPNRGKGWWMKNNNWSYSWSVAHALRWHLSDSKSGVIAKEVNSPEELLLGDVICYDFQGDGRFDHTTIVVAKDDQGMPLVNAHTQNSRMRYWAYEDSTAYTPDIKYKFFSIVNG